MDKCEIYALYLPQYHRTEENDKWWEPGFTEWTAVKRAKSLHSISRQPRIPLEGYYDLSDYHSIEQQAKLAAEHGVDGFVIYHYYSNGKVLLGKPVELLHHHPEINIKYFFSWANHDWRRTWYGYNKEILQKQEYGTESQIREHFNYLLKFFKDDRYKKIEGKPVVSIYKPSYIPNMKEYYDIWNSMAKENGFDGIFFIQTIDQAEQTRQSEIFDAAFDFEPGCTITSSVFSLTRNLNRLRSFLIQKFNLFRIANVYNYKKVASAIMKKHNADQNHYYGVFPGWDNTPRHKRMGTVYKNESSKIFAEMTSKQYAKSLKENKSMLIINAWNEWSEGAYLEPDTFNGYKLLDSIKEIKDK